MGSLQGARFSSTCCTVPVLLPAADRADGYAECVGTGVDASQPGGGAGRGAQAGRVWLHHGGHAAAAARARGEPV